MEIRANNKDFYLNLNLCRHFLWCLCCFVYIYAYPQANSSDLEKANLESYGCKVTQNNQVVLLMNGHEKFEDLFKYVDNAKSFIHMEYFNFRNDSINSLLISHLHKKAQEGVEIRVIYDAFGNYSNNQPFSKAKHDSIASLGIDIQKFDPLRFPWVNHIFPRDHRKIVVIDGFTAYTGGMNVADYYVDGLEGVGPWRDMHMRIHGPAVDMLHNIFVKMWAKQTGHLLTGTKYFPQGKENVGKAGVAIVDREPNVTNKSIRQLYISMLDNAQHKVMIINPYFTPTKSVRKAIERAIERGIDVQIMISEKSDIPLTPDASHLAAYKLAQKGAKVYMFQNGFHHTKAMMIDDQFCTIGSANLDSRSLRYDYEVNTAIFDSQVTMQLVNMFEMDKKDSQILNHEKWNQKTSWKKTVAWFGSILTPFL